MDKLSKKIFFIAKLIYISFPKPNQDYKTLFEDKFKNKGYNFKRI